MVEVTAGIPSDVELVTQILGNWCLLEAVEGRDVQMYQGDSSQANWPVSRFTSLERLHQLFDCSTFGPVLFIDSVN